MKFDEISETRQINISELSLLLRNLPIGLLLALAPESFTIFECVLEQKILSMMILVLKSADILSSFQIKKNCDREQIKERFHNFKCRVFKQAEKPHSYFSLLKLIYDIFMTIKKKKMRED